MTVAPGRVKRGPNPSQVFKPKKVLKRPITNALPYSFGCFEPSFKAIESLKLLIFP